MAVNNQDIICRSWLEGSTAFQQRIPDPTQAGIAATARALQDPMNADMWNEFRGLMNMVGFTIVLNRQFDNPVAFMKKDPLRYGKTIREIAPKWIRAHAFKDDAEKLLKMNRTEYTQWFHTINRADVYEFDYNETELMWALTDDGTSTSINTLLDAAASAAISSDNYDEMCIMINLFAEADKRWKHPLFRQKLNAMPTDEASGKAFLTQVQTYADLLMFPSETYNSVEVPVFAKRDELVLFTTPTINASVNVNTLASVFNLDKAEDARLRKIMIPNFPLPNVVAALTTRDFFECRDTRYGIFPFFDPSTLTTHNFLHHQGMYSVSPYVPCILFTVGEGSEREVIRMNATGLKLTAESNTIAPGGEVMINANLVGNITENDCDLAVRPDAATWEVNLRDAPLNSRTHVDKFGILHLQKSVEAGDVVTVTGVTTYVNPSGATTPYSATITLNVVEPETHGEFTLIYDVKGDTTYGIPESGGAPESVNVDAGTAVELLAVPTTAWVTSDGTESGTPGTWSFNGWKADVGLSGDSINRLENVEANTTVYGAWTFTAN